MISVRLLREAHDAIALKLMGEQPRLGRWTVGQRFWTDRQSEVRALPSFNVTGLDDGSGGDAFILDSSPLDSGDTLG